MNICQYNKLSAKIKKKVTSLVFCSRAPFGWPVSIEILRVSEYAGLKKTDTAVSGKVVQRKRKAYAIIPKGSMGLSKEWVYVLNMHMIKKKKKDEK